MASKVVRFIDEHVVTSKRLGRHVEHDPKSRDFPFEAPEVTIYKTMHHRHFGGILDQGNLGSCTGNATAGAVNTVPLHKPGKHILREADALTLYENATVLDDIPGSYPPDDTGSSGLAAAKAAQQAGYITSYSHAFSVEDALKALQFGPVITGIDWYEGFDHPSPSGRVVIDGQIRGGHEFVVIGFNWEGALETSTVVAVNSWGKDWGHDGRFNFTVAIWRELLDAQGDATILVS